METLELRYSKLEEIDTIAGQIVSFANDNKIWIFEGEMAAGKTTLIKAICKLWAVDDNVSSPTFSIVNEYVSGIVGVVYHFDFYRIKHESEAEAIGCEEYFYSGAYNLIEWPSQIPSLLPDNYLKIEIKTATDNSRTIHLSKHGNRSL